LINLGVKLKIIITMMLLLLLLTPYTGHSKIKFTYVEPFIICDTSGPDFDLSLLPDFVDLIPGSEPVIFYLELRVGVSDPDNVDTVIGSYSNSSEDWVNITLNYDESTGTPNDYAAQALNYTIPGGTSLTIWNIIFFANDSLGNWNVSQIKTMSVSRQSGTIPTNGNVAVNPLIGAIIMIPIVVIIAWYIKSKRFKHSIVI